MFFKNILIACFLTCFFSANLFAQKNTKSTISTAQQKAETLFSQYRYVQAIEAFKSVLSIEPSNAIVIKKLAISYKKINDVANSEKMYEKLVSLNLASSDDYFAYANTLASNEKYTLAIKMYEQCALLNPNDLRAKKYSLAYNNMVNFYIDSLNFKIEMLNINSPQSDFSPAYFKKGMVFSSNRNEGIGVKRVFEWDQTAFIDLYFIDDLSKIKVLQDSNLIAKNLKNNKEILNDDYTYLTSNDNRTIGYTNYNYVYDGELSKYFDADVAPFNKSINSKYHEGPLSFFKNYDSVFFTRNNFNSTYGESVDGVNKLKLYIGVSNNSQNSFDKIKEFPFNSNNYSTGHPAIALGDTVLYFISDMPGGFGGTDIYKSVLRKGHWLQPVNLGPEINTAGNELFPFVDSDNTLYFASDGHPGLGGLDIFTFSIFGASTVKNLGYPANSNADDFGLIFDPKNATGYFSSNRRRLGGDDDIYRIKMNRTFYINVIDGVTKKLIPQSTISVKSVTSSVKPRSIDSENGQFKAGFSAKVKYAISANALGYDFNSIVYEADFNNPHAYVSLYKPGCIVVGLISDKETKMPLKGARVVITDKTINKIVFNNLVGADGKYRFTPLIHNHVYDIEISKDEYFKRSELNVGTRGNKCLSHEGKEFDYSKDFELEKIVIGKAIKIENIYFDLAKFNIRKSAALELDKIVDLLKANPEIIIELSSHTDCRASEQYNMRLSDNRAKASAAYIISKGINKERIMGRGYGESRLVNDCACEGKVVNRICTEEEHQANRRTEFQVTGFLKDKNTTILNNGSSDFQNTLPAK